MKVERQRPGSTILHECMTIVLDCFLTAHSSENVYQCTVYQYTVQRLLHPMSVATNAFTGTGFVMITKTIFFVQVPINRGCYKTTRACFRHDYTRIVASERTFLIGSLRLLTKVRSTAVWHGLNSIAIELVNAFSRLWSSKELAVVRVTGALGAWPRCRYHPNGRPSSHPRIRHDYTPCVIIFASLLRLCHSLFISQPKIVLVRQ